MRDESSMRWLGAASLITPFLLTSCLITVCLTACNLDERQPVAGAGKPLDERLVLPDASTGGAGGMGGTLDAGPGGPPADTVPPPEREPGDRGDPPLDPGEGPQLDVGPDAPLGTDAADAGGGAEAPEEEQPPEDIPLEPPAPPADTGCGDVCPDLVVTSLEITPDPPLAGSPLTVVLTVSNFGAGAAAASTLEVRTGGFSVTRAVPALGPGASSAFELDMPSPAAGQVRVDASVDVTARVEEADEGNNDATLASVARQPPNLVVASLSQSLPNPVASTQLVAYEATILNAGESTAAASVATFQVGGSLATFDVPALDAGESFPLARQVALGSTGNFLVTVVADRDDDVPESDEGDNDAQLTTQTAGPPDLVAESLTQAPMVPALGQTIDYTFTIRNEGASTAPPSTMTFQVGGSLLSFPVPALEPGAAYVHVRSSSFDDEINILVTGIADSDAELAEPDEANNMIRIASRI